MNKNQVIVLYGMPASGKYTMAKRLQEESGVLLDNHYFHDMFKDIIEVSSENRTEYFEMVGMFKRSFMNILRRFYPQNRPTRYIFTTFILQGETLIDELQQLAADIQADFIPIELLVKPEVLTTRCQTEQRKLRKKIASAETMQKIINQYADSLLLFEHPNKLTIDNTNLTEDQTFAMIQKHLENF